MCLYGQAHWRLDKSCKNIPCELVVILPIYDVEWPKKRDERGRMKFADSGLKVHG